MKKVFLTLTTAAALLAFTGCGESTSEEQAQDELEKAMKELEENLEKAGEEVKEDVNAAADTLEAASEEAADKMSK